MIGASSSLLPNQPELSTSSSSIPDIASPRPTNSQTQFNALVPRSANPGSGGMPSAWARITQIRYGSASTTITSSANNGSNDNSVRRPRSVATANAAISSNSTIPAEVVRSNRPASIDHANHTLRRFWPISCHECIKSSAHSGRASTAGPNSAVGEPKAVIVIVSNTASTACWPPTMELAADHEDQEVATEHT